MTVPRQAGATSSWRVQADEFQFWLADADGEDLDASAVDDDLVRAGDAGPTVVSTGTHWGPVLIEVGDYESAPPIGAEWEDVTEVSVRTLTGLCVTQLNGGRRVTVTRRRGDLRVRVAARGRAAGRDRYQAGARAPIVEHFLIQAWPAPFAPAQTIRTVPVEPMVETAPPIFLDTGRSAAARINRDLAGGADARPLTDQTGTVRAGYDYRGTRRRLFKYAADLSLWTSAGGSGGGSDMTVGGGFLLSANDPDRDIFDGLPTGPERPWTGVAPSCHYEARVTYRELSAPASATTELQWYRVQHDPHARTALLAQPTILHISTTQHKDAAGKPVTTFSVEHAQLPRAWVDDFHDIWKCKLENGDRVFRLGD